MTLEIDSAMIFKNISTYCLIEVAYFMSSFPDVAGTKEGESKESAPKGYNSCGYAFGRKVKNLTTVILGFVYGGEDGALSDSTYNTDICG